jgi:hypothetical protein
LRRLVSLALLLLLLVAFLPVTAPAQAQGAPRIAVKSVYTLDRYGFATINESVRFTNNGSALVQAPSLTIGFGNLSSKMAAYNLTVPNGFTLATPAAQGGPYTVTSAQSIPAKGNASFVFSALLSDVVSKLRNGSLEVLTLSSPSISTRVDTLINVVRMPASTAFIGSPQGLKASITGSNNTYSSTVPGATPAAATSVRAVAETSGQDFNPLHVYDAKRMVTVSANGNPLVTDTVEFENMGTTALSLLYVNLLAPSSTHVTVLTGTEPRLVNPVTLPLQSGAIPLIYFASGYPNAGVQTDANFTISYQYPLGTNYYSVSGGEVTTNIPDTLPISAFVDSYSITLSLPQGASSSHSTPTTLGTAGQPVTPWQRGVTKFTYGLTLGWAVNDGIPAASVIFLLLLIGLFVSRATTASVEESEEEETSTELASDMIKAFEEKTTLINGLWPEIEGKDPNEVDKEYFDELRGRLDSFRSRALQRLNEVKQKSTSQRFSEVVNQMQVTERELDRAAKDKLNLYQQYYLRQMRKEVYERLNPQYTKRLEKALDQLSDELHNVQREAKLL